MMALSLSPNLKVYEEATKVVCMPQSSNIDVKKFTLYGVVAGIVAGVLHFVFVFGPANDLPSKTTSQIVGFIIGDALTFAISLGVVGWFYARSVNQYNRRRGSRT